MRSYEKTGRITLLLALMLCVSISIPVLAQDILTCEVIDIYDEAFVLDAATGEWNILEVGNTPGRGDRIKTGADGTITLSLEGDMIRLGPATEVELSDLTVTREEKEDGTFRESTTTIITLILGKVYARVKELRGDSLFEVRTEISFAGVRGTEFSVEALAAMESDPAPQGTDETGGSWPTLSKTTVVTRWGPVTYVSINENGEPIGPEVKIGNRKYSEVTPGNPATDPAPAPKDALKALTTVMFDFDALLDQLRDLGGKGGSCS
ncbi:MAG: FecR domain-containing protein [Deltaproteobacteria bacterium]|nr:FecR domain-containing protein [Candidatus Zymogenaceae bacterium]